MPLALEVTAANVPDGQVAVELVDSVSPMQGPRGRPKSRPDYIVGDRAYGWEENLREMESRGIVPLLARPSDKTHGSGLGFVRWVVERTLAWFNNYRRLRLCYEKNGEAFKAFHELAALLICFKKTVESEPSG